LWLWSGGLDLQAGGGAATSAHHLQIRFVLGAAAAGKFCGAPWKVILRMNISNPTGYFHSSPHEKRSSSLAPCFICQYRGKACQYLAENLYQGDKVFIDWFELCYDFVALFIK
jgi:hypothetical protein